MPASERQDYLVAEVRTGTPAVFVDRQPRGVDADSVVVDNRSGGDEAVAHLLAHGHRRIAALVDLTSIRTADCDSTATWPGTPARAAPDEPLVVTGLRSTDEEAQATHAMMSLARPTHRDLRVAQHPLHRGDPPALAELGRSQRSPWSASTTSPSPTS